MLPDDDGLEIVPVAVNKQRFTRRHPVKFLVSPGGRNLDRRDD